MTTEEFVEFCQCGETTTVQYKECFTGRLQQLGFLKREGGRKDGYWVVTEG